MASKPAEGKENITSRDKQSTRERNIRLIVGLAMGLIVAGIWARAGVTVWAVVGAIWGGLAGASFQEYRERQTRPESFETAGGLGGVAGGCGLIFGWLGLVLIAAICRISVPEMPGRITTPFIVGSIGGALGGIILGTVIERAGLLLIRFVSLALAEQAPPSIRKARGIFGLFVWSNGAMVVGMFTGTLFGFLYGLVFDVQGVFGSGVGAGILAGAIAGASVGLIAGIIIKLRAQDNVKTMFYDAIFGAFGGLVGGSIFEYVFRNFPS